MDEASEYIQERWQGMEYRDGIYGFHTDYSTYELVGFTFADIGRVEGLGYERTFVWNKPAVPWRYDFANAPKDGAKVQIRDSCGTKYIARWSPGVQSDTYKPPGWYTDDGVRVHESGWRELPSGVAKEQNAPE